MNRPRRKPSSTVAIRQDDIQWVNDFCEGKTEAWALADKFTFVLDTIRKPEPESTPRQLPLFPQESL